MAKISISAMARAELEARCDQQENVVPTLTWATAIVNEKRVEGWSFVFFPRANVEAGIRNVDGIELVVSDIAISERKVDLLRIHFMDGRFEFNEERGV